MAYSAISLNEEPVDSQSIRENLGKLGQQNTGCFDDGISTSRASEGVKDGSVSKIGTVSGEAIWSKSTKVW